MYRHLFHCAAQNTPSGGNGIKKGLFPKYKMLRLRILQQYNGHHA
jgi:hypothetical protein